MSAQVDTGQTMKEMADEDRQKLIQDIAQAITQQASENASNAGNVDAPINAGEGNLQHHLTRLEPKKASRAAKKKNPDRPLKPLNSFMAYRTYVMTAFPGVVQMLRSEFAKKMWKKETRAIWILLGEAYSQVRDVARRENGNQVNCEEIITSAASFVGLPPADIFCKLSGWDLSVVDNTQSIQYIGRSPDKISIKSVSVRDIVEHCYAVGVAPRPTDPNTGKNVSVSIMGAPTTVDESPSDTEVSNKEQVNSGDFVSISFVAKPKAVNDTSGITEIMTEERVMPEEDIMQAAAEPEDTDNMMLPLRHDEVFIEQQTVLTESGDQYPFNMQFHPEIDQPALAMDFDMIQDSFDAFDVDATFNVEDWIDWGDEYVF
ncbi:MAG: hypothetical protein Q9160_003824 [Pyrenula sp. 1 TL-2023]